MKVDVSATDNVLPRLRLWRFFIWLSIQTIGLTLPAPQPTPLSIPSREASRNGFYLSVDFGFLPLLTGGTAVRRVLHFLNLALSYSRNVLLARVAR